MKTPAFGAQVMSIINITPDSFSGTSQACEVDDVCRLAQLHLDNGADILDIGACSTRPDGIPVDCDEERRRLMPALRALRNTFPLCRLSIDTFRSEIAAEALDDYNVNIINDISGGEWDCNMFNTLGQRRAAYVLSYMPRDIKHRFLPVESNNIISDMLSFFNNRIMRLHNAGVNDIIIDPGFGFAKTIEQNYQTLALISQLKTIGCPVLIGLSRKSMIYKPLGTTPEYALNGTTALHMAALINGADILRVHDTKQAREVITLYDYLSKGNN